MKSRGSELDLVNLVEVDGLRMLSGGTGGSGGNTNLSAVVVGTLLIVLACLNGREDESGEETSGGKGARREAGRVEGTEGQTRRSGGGRRNERGREGGMGKRVKRR